MTMPDTEDLIDPASSEDTAEVLNRALTRSELDDLTDSEDDPVEVTFGGQDFDVAGLVRRQRSESMLIPSFGTSDERIDTEGYQRGFVWSKAQMDRFIESLLLGYPVPAIFLVRQLRDNRLLVLDGQQRLVTLRRFYDGSHRNKPFALSNVASHFKGLTYSTLPENLKFKLDDSYMQAIIVTADGSDEVNDAIYQLFERLNSGGTQLTPHEIRVALAAGPLIAYIEEINGQPEWRSLYGARSARLRDQELILRAIALYIDSANYARPLKTFLNTFAETHRTPGPDIEEAGGLLTLACRRLASEVGPRSLRRPGGNQVNVAQTEAVLVGLMSAISAGFDPQDLGSRIEQLQASEEFAHATTRATADKDSVNLRLQMARRAFETP